MERIGGLIRQARMERGLTQRELAERLHVTDKAVSKWERDICRPDVELLEPLARELDIPLLRLLGVEKEPEQGVRDLLESSAAEMRRKAGQINRRWGGLLAVLLLAGWVWLVFSGCRLSPEEAARGQLFFSDGTENVVLRERLYDCDMFLFDAGETYRMTFVRKFGPLWAPLGFETYGPKRSDTIEYLGGATFQGTFGFMLLRCHDPEVETVTVDLGEKNAITQPVNGEEITVLRWPAEMQQPFGRTPTAVAQDGDGTVLYHLDMLQYRGKYGILTIDPNIYHWWEGPEGSFPGYEEDLKNR